MFEKVLEKMNSKLPVSPNLVSLERLICCARKAKRVFMKSGWNFTISCWDVRTQLDNKIDCGPRDERHWLLAKRYNTDITALSVTLESDGLIEEVGVGHIFFGKRKLKEERREAGVGLHFHLKSLSSWRGFMFL